MRTLLVFLFALAALGMGGLWVLAQMEPAAEEAYVMDEAAPAPMEPEAPQEVEPQAADMASAEDAAAMSEEESAELSDSLEAAADEFGLDDIAGIGTRSLETEPFEVAAAPPPPPSPAPDSDPIVATQSIAEQFESREVTYNRPPSTLALNKPIDVSLVINATGVEGAGAEALSGFDGEIIERDVALTDEVAAQLTGPGFEIVAQHVEPRQRLSPRVLNRWQWRVTPTEEGTQVLMLEIFGYAAGASGGEPLDAYRDEIVVEVRNLDRVVSFAQQYEPVFAIGAGVAGGLSALFGFLRFRNDRRRRKAS